MDSPSSKPPRRTARGTTLIEAMVALSLLLVGIAGTMKLQVLGVTSNAGARATTEAYQLARELTQALSQLRPEDPLLAFHYRAEVPPPEFGHLLVNGKLDTTRLATAWNDGMSLPGVTSDAALFRYQGGDPDDPSVPVFRRFWQVWQLPNASTAAATGGGINAVAVVVVYREPGWPQLREAVLLTQVSNTGLAASFVAAYR